MTIDDLGEPFPAIGRPRRVVSLVPSTTEAVALAAPELLVGVTDYCTHPPGLDVERIGGSKYPKLDRILALRPDLVLANAEENRLADAEALRAAGIAVWTSFPRTVPEALSSAARVFEHALRLPVPAWVDEAAALWREPLPVRARAVVPIWRRPWMVLGAGTFAGDVLRRLGVANVFADAGDPYPKTSVEDMLEHAPDLVVLPDEPYAFTATDGPEAFGGLPCALVPGRHLTWHGPSLTEAHTLLRRRLDDALA
ncbi:helical backbone metal receptor [Phytomonospora endophytica]|uniref:ABC-type Fe3+-hydroxamate transport system substrate-binding protein n=1 Tax=Phytomonospora endophytica TaxID=714109 RepID=A0A841FBM8_9ACTN|nr:helical backbone metal receptor [Phytomonospora endophytica]MBB6032413.1 ABC-type Fe3+-hydroxamate transport system substrate-binding protein [Phytomonospora endophytica]GIG66441.1 ABC transporter substrate-binding protein [Phytomonospora endophytica]